ncbi:pimeloyl-ACP methyl ester carboxylesterase [Paenibacillus endophyticus]|uniref:Pimeloyl-ACP methyl ester carboxylesterase n=1 Tax=Paenibacillus endophyticus TaxID=1294268 RepID=A0A7W5C764_9BACL|nr:alpha/beta hydrolase [Paenibacillus endophyticus]MBB3152405.1 pimeloyl-ACP methyl ester carboxylesterase [Paenibacillus endophyticus]
MGKEDALEVYSIAQRKVLLNNGLELAYYDSHPHDGGAADDITEVVVLLHGYCGSSAYWEQIVEELEQSVRILALDARGHGRSSAPEEEVYTMEKYADDVAELLIKLNVHNAVLLGHSLGGYITLAFAEKYSKKLSAIGLIHSTALPDGEAAKENRDKAVAALEQNGVPAFIDGLIPKLFAPANLEALQGEVERGKVIGYGTSLRGAVATAKGMKAREDRKHVIEQLELPVLLVAGANDKVIPLESAFAAVNAQTTKVQLDSAGHMGMVEQPKALIAAIRSFVNAKQ